MLTLIQAVRLLGLDDSELIHFCTAPNSFYSLCASVSRLRKQVDMGAIRVWRISPSHYRCSDDLSWEFIIAPKDMDAVRKASWY